jgi:hypothetical protein
MTDLTDLTVDTLAAGSITVSSAPGVEIGGYAVPTLNSFGDGIHVLQVAMATFDPSLTAGMRTIGAHGLGVTLPIHAIVVGGFMDVNTVFTSAGGDAGTVAISVEGANDIQAAAACSGAPWSTIGRKAIVPKANTPESTSVKATAAREITATVAGQALTAGKVTVYLYFIVGKASA